MLTINFPYKNFEEIYDTVVKHERSRKVSRDNEFEGFRSWHQTRIYIFLENEEIEIIPEPVIIFFITTRRGIFPFRIDSRKFLVSNYWFARNISYRSISKSYFDAILLIIPFLLQISFRDQRKEERKRKYSIFLTSIENSLPLQREITKILKETVKPWR